MKQNKETLKQFFETGDKPTQQQYADLIDSYIDAKQPEGKANRRFVIDETGEISVASEQQTPEYTLSPISGTNAVDLLKDGVSVSQIDLTPYLDNTNLARLVSGTVDVNGLATFTRDDNSTFTVDLSNLKDTVPQYQAGTNISIDETDPNNPVINATAGGTLDTSNLVPFTGGTKQLDLANDIKLGSLFTKVGKARHNVYLKDKVTGNNIIKHQNEYWDGAKWVSTSGMMVGFNAGINNTGVNASAYGANSLKNNTGNNANGFGHQALYNNTGTGSNGFGSDSLYNNIGTNSNGFGHQALYNNTGTGSNGFGSGSLYNNIGTNSNGFGHQALFANEGNHVSGFGYFSARENTGDYASGFGYNALRRNTGINASGFGTSALTNNKGTNAVGVGYQSLYYNIGHNAVGIGVDTLRNNEGQNNTSIGHNSFGGFYKDLSNPVVFLGSDVDVVTNQITITGHGFGSTGTKFKMMTEPSSFLGGLNSTAIVYEFEVVDSNTIKSITNISSKDDVTQYTFSKQLAIINSTTIGANSQPDKSNQVVLGDANIEEVTTVGDYISTGIGKGLVLTTPNGTKQYRISIDDSGNIVTTLI
ncbi:hypothetical protein [Tenacibaculum singaporense]|uniref:hypothetical protein n=1 Tax=Tenacibaculum singaporense TaxID=2358479 RepID=UPI000F65D2A4|nr:hypothetical protein [Tenacibaculum singaporense]RSC95043.1 hypothetical protein EI424_05190 [Tenacibaculum singaporense]